MLKEFKEYIVEMKLLGKGEKTLLTVSGGRDSIVLCELFNKAGFSFAIAHCNFQLRGKEADEDENFVKKLAKEYKTSFYSKRFRTEIFAKENKLSIQEAARVLRYEWFEEIRKKNKYNSIATAHHKDDEAETFFINLIRGTGIAGLHGILPKRGRLIRPLLFATRNQIDEFVKKNKLHYREDSSNTSTQYVRNKIRHNILPLFEEINPSFINTLSDEIKKLSEVEKIYKHFIETNQKKVLTGNSISISELKKSNFSSVLLYEILKKYQFNFEASTAVFLALDSEPGKIFYSPTHRLVKDRETLIITNNSSTKTNEVFIVSEKLKSVSTPVQLEISEINNATKFKIPDDKNVACLDSKKLIFPLEIRKWKKGDYFYPLGMNKKKKLSNFFTDIKLSIPEKENIWLLCSGENIVYVIGKRIDERYKVGKETKLIYLVQCIDKNV